MCECCTDIDFHSFDGSRRVAWDLHTQPLLLLGAVSLRGHSMSFLSQILCAITVYIDAGPLILAHRGVGCYVVEYHYSANGWDEQWKQR